MAKIVKKNNHLESEYSASVSEGKSGAVLFILLLVLSGACLAAYLHFNSSLFLIGAVVMFFCGTISLRSGNGREAVKEQNILAAGIEGENSTANLLKMLPASYTVFQDVVVKYDGKISEIDNIVVGSTGIFIIETKNHNGLITGDYADKDWLQSKVGRGGTAYSNGFYSPVKQVGTHIFRFKNFLLKKEIRAYINGIVYFSNPQAQVKISGEPEGVPVFACSERGGQDMLDYIMSTNRTLPDSVLRKVIEVLNG